MSKLDSFNTEKNLEKFFIEPNNLFTRIEILPYPTVNRPVFWSATTYIKAPAPPEINPLHMAWGGTGSDIGIGAARIKSISEAFERWALHVLGLKAGSEYGFNLDESSTGLAAFPGQEALARSHALNEAMERFAFGQINVQPFQIKKMEFNLLDRFSRLSRSITAMLQQFPDEKISFYEIPILTSNARTVVFCRWTLARGGMVAGFACEESRNQAKFKALIEAFRHRMILNRITQDPVSRTERALLHWANEVNAGQIDDWFEVRLRSSLIMKMSETLIVDTKIPTPWEPVMYLWRCYLDGTQPAHRCPVNFLYY